VRIGVVGSYGRGAMFCRTGATFPRPWGRAAMYTLEAASSPCQARRRESTDFVMLVMNNRGMDALLSIKVKLRRQPVGGGRPQGAHAEASTDAPCAPKF